MRAGTNAGVATLMLVVIAVVWLGVFPSCGSAPSQDAGDGGAAKAAAPAAAARPDFPPASSFGGFDAQRAYAHVEKTVALGPHPPGSEANRLAGDYIRGELQSYGCAVEEDNFEASTARGPIRMRNVVGKSPGASDKVVLLLSHYDTKILDTGEDFVGANDPGSSIGVVLELARNLCGQKRALTYWFGFVDGEESFGEWSDTNGTFGSRQMAAKLSLSGELKKVKAVILADLVGHFDPVYERESNSTKWLKDMVWNTAKRLGYEKHFVAAESPVEDDHLPFLKREVPAVDIIGFNSYPHWHQPSDTLDKISPRSLALVGHVILETLPALEKRFR